MKTTPRRKRVPAKTYGEWNPTKDALLKSVWGRMRVAEVVKLVGMSQCAIYKRAHFLGLALNRRAA